MPNPVVAIAGSSVLGSITQSRAASKAAGAQSQAAEMGIEEQRRQFDEVRKLLEPYVQAGQPALQGMQAMLGLQGAEAQQQAIAGIEQSPLLQAMMRQGEEAMLQNASATGGLRGGNLQGALAQFRPQMLQDALDRQYQRLGGLTALGQQSAAGVGTAGIQTGQSVAGLLQQQGAAQAGGALGRGAAFGQLAQIPGQLAGFQLATGRSIFGGAPIQPGVVSGLPAWAVMPPPGG
ncbi:MAG: hypothetical protein ING31_07640 [Burkholderiales bacterium]|nr:hypothetical protein [Burkholderiales bacterium]